MRAILLYRSVDSDSGVAERVINASFLSLNGGFLDEATKECRDREDALGRLLPLWSMKWAMYSRGN